MKGVLYKNNNWYVRITEEGDWDTHYQLHPQDVIYCLDSDDLKKVEVEIVKEYIDRYTNQVQKYAKLISEEMRLDTWDEIFVEIEGSLHSELPKRVKNWLKNKYHEPKIKL